MRSRRIIRPRLAHHGDLRCVRCGVLAVGKVLGLNAQQLTWAMGSASAQASGLVETLGFMAKSVGCR